LVASDEHASLQQYWHAHNEYLTQASQHGLVGLGLFLALMVLCWRSAAALPAMESALVRWSLAVFALSALTDSSLHNEWEGWAFVLWLWLAATAPRARALRTETASP
jgi:O-antigen ligase